jgi:pimeloyl-ACP methyl ester carboxylesterase
VAMVDTKVMDLPDGRELAWLELGKPKGPPVFAFHGTPGSRLQVSFLDDVIAKSGVRFIALDRPGYGHSTFHKGRQLVDWPRDVAALADHLKLAEFSVIGISGGGPHAAVCARFLGDRLHAAGIVSGAGRFDDPNAEGGNWVGITKVLARLAGRSRYFVYPLMAAQDVVTRRWPERALKAAVGQMPAADAAIMQRPEVMAAFIEDSRRSSSTTAMAASQDFELFSRDWGFRLEDIEVPVHLWHGDADRNVPFSHGVDQAARIPGSTFHECPGEGHLLVVEHLGEILHTVTAT